MIAIGQAEPLPFDANRAMDNGPRAMSAVPVLATISASRQDPTAVEARPAVTVRTGPEPAAG